MTHVFIGASVEADFESDAWSFEMLGEYRVGAGRYAIMREQDYLALRAEVEKLRSEVIHLRIYAPGQHQAHTIRMAPHINPTDFAAWGIKQEPDGGKGATT